MCYIVIHFFLLDQNPIHRMLEKIFSCLLPCLKTRDVEGGKELGGRNLPLICWFPKCPVFMDPLQRAHMVLLAKEGPPECLNRKEHTA